VEKGNTNSVTDGGVGAEVAYAGLRGAVLNVRINLPGITDANFVSEMNQTCDQLIREADGLVQQIRSRVIETIDRM